MIGAPSRSDTNESHDMVEPQHDGASQHREPDEETRGPQFSGSEDTSGIEVNDEESLSSEEAPSEDSGLPPHRRHRQNSSAMIEDADRTELRRIATALSRRHSDATGGPTSRIHTLATVDEDHPALDPQSPQFDLGKWLKNFAKTLHEQDISRKETGVAFKNLRVSGTGAALRVQGTVGSWLLSPLRIGELFSFGKKKPKQILHGLDGLIGRGELLIVLGRPGSGCSTFLKTICGELHGLSVDQKSSIHYDGIPQAQMKKEFKGEAIYNQEVCASPSSLPLPLMMIAALNRACRSTNTSPTSQSDRPWSLPPRFGRHRVASTICRGPSSANTLLKLSWPRWV